MAKDRNYAEWLEEIRQDGKALRFVPDRYITQEMCDTAVKATGEALEFVPSELITEGMCDEALKTYGRAILFVPEEFATEERCFDVIRNDGWAIKYMPDNLLTEDMCIYAVARYPEDLEDLSDVFKTEKVCLTAIEQDEKKGPDSFAERNMPGLPVTFIPDELKNEEFYSKAIDKNPYVFHYIPDYLKTEALCLAAIEFRPLFFAEDVPDYLKTDAVCQTAVSRWSGLLSYVPEEKITQELCLLAVDSDPFALEYIPTDMVTDEMYRKVLDTIEPLDLFRLSDDVKTERFCSMLIKEDYCSDALTFIPNDKKTEKLCIEAVEQYGPVFSKDGDIDKTHISQAERDQLCELYKWCFEFVPERLRLIEVCAEFAFEDLSFMEYISEADRDTSIVEATLNGDITFSLSDVVFDAACEYFKFVNSIREAETTTEKINDLTNEISILQSKNEPSEKGYDYDKHDKEWER